MHEAEALRRKLLADIDGIATRVVPLSESAPPAPNLLDFNLISGVIDACNAPA